MRRAVAVAIVIAGCHHPEPPAPPATDLIVVSSGLPPQRVLRYAPAKGTKTTLELAIEGRLEAGEIKSASPGLVFALELGVDDVLPDGTIATTSTIVDLTTRATREQPGAAHALDEADQLKGLAITAKLSPDGKLSDVRPVLGERTLSDVAKTELAQLAQALPQLAMPLPTAPVGVGAKWRSSRAITPASTLAMTAVTTIDVTSIEGQVVSFAMTSTVHGADQTAMQDGVAVDVKGITGTATGRGSIDLAKLVLAGTISSELRMDMTASGERTPMMMALEVAVSAR